MKAITIEGTPALITPVEGALPLPVGVLGVFRGPPKRDILPPLPRTGVEDSNVLQSPIYRIILKPSSRQQFLLRFPTVIPRPLFFASLGAPKTTPHRTISGEQLSEMRNGQEKEFAEPEHRSSVVSDESVAKFRRRHRPRRWQPKKQGGHVALEENAKLMFGLVVRE
jgi:hypothetical protein